MKEFLIALSLALASSLGVAAETWPARPVRIIVPFPPGSSPDLVARMLTDKLAQALGQPVIVENKPGAGGNLGTGLVAKAEPDGYTLGLSIPGPLAVNTVLYKKMDYDPFTELAPLTLVAVSPNVLIVNPGFGDRKRQRLAPHHGTAENADGRRYRARTLPRQPASHHLHPGQPGTSRLRRARHGHAAGAVGPGQGHCSDQQREKPGVARSAHRGRGPASPASSLARG